MPQIVCKNYYIGGDSVKKITALLLIFAALFSFAACKVDTSPEQTETFSPNEFQSQLNAQQAERQSQIEASIQAQEEINEEIDEYIAKVGKTKKNKELVIKVDWALGRKYQKFVFDRKGNTDYRLDYFFFDSEDNYEATIQEAKDNENKKVVEKDKDMKMVVVKNSKIAESTFDRLYEAYGKQEVIDLGYSIVE